MIPQKESPEQIRERLRQEELKNNPTGAFSDGINRSLLGGFADYGWKYTGIIIVLLIIGYVFYKLSSS